MKRRNFASLVRGFGPALLLSLLYSGPGVADTSQGTISAARQTELVQLVRNDCGACHGLTLKGGLGSPLTPESVADKPDQQLRETILRGRPGTAMPGWSDFMTESEAQWVVDNLKTGFPNAR